MTFQRERNTLLSSEAVFLHVARLTHNTTQRNIKIYFCYFAQVQAEAVSPISVCTQHRRDATCDVKETSCCSNIPSRETRKREKTEKSACFFRQLRSQCFAKSPRDWTRKGKARKVADARLSKNKKMF